MAARILALMIPLAITLPCLETSSRFTAAPPLPIAQAQPSSPAELSREAMRVAEVSVPHVAIEPPAIDAVRQVQQPPAARKPTRVASPAKAVLTAKASMRSASRQAKSDAKRPPSLPDCKPFVHCAPVVEAKVTPVSRRAM